MGLILEKTCIGSNLDWTQNFLIYLSCIVAELSSGRKVIRALLLHS